MAKVKELTRYTSVKVFAATKHHDREQLGETVTWWLNENPTIEIIDTRVLQSSDQAFHCLSIVVFYRRGGL